MKNKIVMAGLVSLAVGVAGCTNKQPDSTAAAKSYLTELATPAPMAEQKPHSYSYHGYTIEDPWNWLRDSSYPNTDDQPILDYLEAENAYYQEWLQPQKALTDTLFEEFKGRVDESETSVPWVSNGYEYRWEFQDGKEYRTWLRKPAGDPDAEEVVFLDENQLAEGHEYFVRRGLSVSHDNKLLAYSVDTNGSERYEIHIVDLSTGEAYADTLTDSNGSVSFAKDGSIVYGLLEEGKWRTQSINRHVLGTEQSEDAVLIAEPDDGMFLGFYTTSDDEFLVLSSGNGELSEAHVLPNDDLTQEPKLLASREEGFRYSVDHAHGNFYILANDQHVNFRLAKTASGQPGYDNWETLIEGSDKTYLTDIQTFQNFIALEQSVNGLEQLTFYYYDGKQKPLEFPEALYTASFGNNPEFDQPHVRINYESMVTPDTVFDYQIESGELVTRKEKRIPSGYDKSLYETKRLMIKARDGVEVPVSVMMKKGTKLDGNSPLHLYAYGAYGSGMKPRFSTIRLSLVDRGVTYAIAHVRGGDEMGYQWYLDGRLTARQNTFNDFVDVAKGLVDLGYASAGNISISGRSAGGKLMGAAVVQAPELWSGVMLGVPFVDVLNTMLDTSLPLTPPEWLQWGNPIEDKAAFELILSYSPYDNIEKREYPPMLVTGGLNDPRVTYWEPAKWTAKMRHYKTDNNLLVMRMNMGAGHFANSGRYGRLMDYAEEFAFILQSHGISK